MVALTPNPSHVVTFHDDEDELAAQVAQFLATGLGAGERVIVIAGPSHQRAFRRELAARSIDLDRATGSQQLVLLDARELLARFMVAGMPDPERFRQAMGDVLAAPLAAGGRVRVYGEMVDLLWQDGNREGALRLEDLWNQLGAEHRFSLLCAYAMSNFHGEGGAAHMQHVCATHGQIVPLDIVSERIRDDESRRRQTELRLRLLIESIKDYAIFMLDPAGNVASWNPGAERIKGYRAGEILGRHFSTFYPEEDVKAGKCEMELEVAAATGRFEDEAWRVRKDGTQFWANVVISAVRDETNELIGFAKVTRDLTDRRRAEMERAARLAAEEAGRAKDEFLAMLGHELRNPLAPILTALQLARLRGHDLRELDVVERQTRHLMRLVDDLLDVPRITQGKVDLQLERVEMAEVVAQAIEVAAPVLDRHRHILAIDVPRHDCAVIGDRGRLAQVICNLVTNAAKYSDPMSRITVSAAAGEGRVRLRVRDHGIGIEPGLLPHIFDSYVQQPGTRDRSMGGLGLGLSIVRGLVELHHGKVSARSDGAGKGSEFEIDLPMAEPVAVAPVANNGTSGAEPVASPAIRRVLIVDDNPDAAELLAEVISALGHEVRVAHDGPLALETARQLEPDVALVDIGLPLMDGYQLAGHLGREPWASRTFLVAVTGYAQDEDRRRSREAGFHEHIVKPLDLATVRRILDASADWSQRAPS